MNYWILSLKVYLENIVDFISWINTIERQSVVNDSFIGLSHVLVFTSAKLGLRWSQVPVGVGPDGTFSVNCAIRICRTVNSVLERVLDLTHGGSHWSVFDSFCRLQIYHGNLNAGVLFVLWLLPVNSLGQLLNSFVDNLKLIAPISRINYWSLIEPGIITSFRVEMEDRSHCGHFVPVFWIMFEKDLYLFAQLLYSRVLPRTVNVVEHRNRTQFVDSSQLSEQGQFRMCQLHFLLDW